MNSKKIKWTFSDKAIMDWARENLPPILEAKAQEVARNVSQKTDKPIVVSQFFNKNGRPVAGITIKHPSGLLQQAKKSALTLSAAEAGLDTRRR